MKLYENYCLTSRKNENSSVQMYEVNVCTKTCYIHRQFAPGVKKNKNVWWIDYWYHVYNIHIPRHRQQRRQYSHYNIHISRTSQNRLYWRQWKPPGECHLLGDVGCVFLHVSPSYSQSVFYTPVLSYLAYLYIKRTVVVLSVKMLILKPNSLFSVVIVYLLLKYKIVSKKITREIINWISTFL